ncbi:ABC transporter ATP-binding protein [Desulfuromonas versatilis]|uniref:ABC transporter ATP-binding protein n=1 Tax=Desulfuromonas versatilis TaxID=2802975 RepID=A0ABM8HUC2_9BACT|nr:ATP-binding cassette domain-containing protein [Desulfuromonas versatilis]BCR06535.1 ABC transporter ATP-binding protein [Desulfuromonas versatilis]
MSERELLQQPVSELLEQRPYLRDFFVALQLGMPGPGQCPAAFFAGLQAAQLAELGLDHAALAAQFVDFARHMEQFQHGGDQPVRKVTLLGGRDKQGRPEDVQLEFAPGEVVCVVGPTGSGKSRLLADIECMAQGDTPSGRRILLDDRPPDEAARLSGEQRLVAQLSQNMNFVMDLSVREFLTLHAESRLVDDSQAVVEQIFATAVELAGEPFTAETPVTALSGGQSRALMIADTACLSASPIVLIDEIENAGVDRRRALELLVKKEKIVLMATHDPLLALSGDRRLVIAGGGIRQVLVTSERERANRRALEALDRRLLAVREALRRGETIDFDF